MRAIRIHHHGDSSVLKLENIASPVSHPDRAVVEMHVAALNHLDLWVRNGIKGIPLPLIPGSDGAGIIREIGRNVKHVKAGDRVLIQPLVYCGKCSNCLSGHENYCTDWGILGEHMDGTLAELVLIPGKNLYAIPSDLGFQEAAAFALVSQTAYTMLVDRAKISSKESVFIWGASSGLGSIAIQIAKSVGSTVIAASSSAENLEKASALGADFTLNHKTGNISASVKEITGGQGVDVVFEHVGEATWNTSLKMLGKGGRIVTCGATTGARVEIDIRHLYYKQQSILGSTMGNRAAFENSFELVKSGKIKPVVDRKFPMEEIQAAHQYLEEGAQFGKVMIQVS
ncbi:MAG: zinc-binding dehydrogenase [Candidatus Neomarinimicrobiota bacterium]